MIPLWLIIRIRGKSRFFLFIPLVLIYLLLLPFVILGVILLPLFMLGGRRWSRAKGGLIAFSRIYSLLFSLRGLDIGIRSANERIRFIVK